MNCREFVDFLMTYLDEELPEAQRSVFEEHMRECPQCVVYLDTYKETVRLSKEACEMADDPAGGIPEDVPEDLVQAVLQARKTL